MFKPGDTVIYTGLPGELANGGLYLVESVGNNMLTLMNHGKHFLKDFYPLREFNGNDEIHEPYLFDEISGEWTLPSDRSSLNLMGLVRLCNEDSLQTVLISDVGGIGWDLPERMRGLTCACCGGERFITADMDKPIFLIEGLPDPYLGRRYRQMDGKHRTAKRIYFGHTTTPAYVFHIDDLLPYFN